MRCLHLAALGAALFSVGCVDGLYSFIGPIGEAPIRHGALEQAPVECGSEASVPFGYGADTSSLSRVIEEPAKRAAVQNCMWEKGMRVTHGLEPQPGTAGSISKQK